MLQRDVPRPTVFYRRLDNARNTKPLTPIIDTAAAHRTRTAAPTVTGAMVTWPVNG